MPKTSNNVIPMYEIRRAGIFDVVRVYRFFVDLEKDLYARRFYRYLPCDTFWRRIKAFFFLFKRLLLNHLVSLTNRYFLILMGIVDGKVIGICHIDINLAKKTGSYGIAVLRDFRGRGIGSILSSEAIKYCRNLDVNKIFLTVDTDNVVGIKLYRKLGFKVIELIEKGDFRYTTKEYVDIYRMMLTLK